MIGTRRLLQTFGLPVLPLIVLAAGCASQQPPARSVSMGETFTLRVAESAAVYPRDVVLQFSEVVADSRCPEDVVCVWEGDAEVSVRAVAADLTSRELRLRTSEGAREAEFAGLTVRLVRLEPAPREGKPPRQADYELTIEVAGR